MRSRFEERWIVREMYRSTRVASYRRGDRSMYMVRMKMKDGRKLEIPFDCEGKTTPFNFVIHFLIYHIFYPREIEWLELYQDRIYCESYRPADGWFKKGEERT